MKAISRCMFLFAAFLALITLTPSPAKATIVKKVELDGLVSGSAKIVHATVRSSTAAWCEDNCRIWTTYTLDIVDTLKGSDTTEMTIRVRGGTVGDRAQHVSGAPHLKLDEESVLFLWIDNNQRYRILGMGQGRFKVDRPEGEAATVRNSFRGVTVIQNLDGEKEVKKSEPIDMELESFIDTVRDLAGTAAVKEDKKDAGEDEGSSDESEEGEGE